MKKIDYKPRWLALALRQALALMEEGAVSVITLTGPRQSGKTTLVRNEPPFSRWHYINLDNLETLAVAHREPDALFTKEKNVVIDEIQRAPKLLLKVKELADMEGYRFLLTGSANLLLLRKVSESLAGRTAIFYLAPFSSREWAGKGPGLLLKVVKGEEPSEGETEEFYPLERRLTEGSMPPALLLSSGHRLWWEGYVRTYLERDLRDISSISNLWDFHRLLEFLAFMSGGLLEEASLARRVGISPATVHRWINLLEASFILHKLPPFLKSRKARLWKRPKVYLVDPALSFHLMGTAPKKLSQEEWGRLFENFVFLQLHALCSSFGGRLFYWRIAEIPEKEVDFIWEYEGEIIPIEAKYKEKLSPADAEGILRFCREQPCRVGIIVYRGKRIYEVLKNIWAVPVWEI